MNQESTSHRFCRLHCVCFRRKLDILRLPDLVGLFGDMLGIYPLTVGSHAPPVLTDPEPALTIHPCCDWSPMRTCHRHYPGRFHGACSLVHLHRLRPSLCNSQGGSCNCFFGACSAFTHVTVCTLAESPCDPLRRKLRQLRCLRCRFDCFYRVERTSSRGRSCTR